MDIKPVIPVQTVWNRETIFALPINEQAEPLVSVSYLPEKIIVSPQYFIQGLAGTLPEIFLRSGAFEHLVKATHSLPSGYKLVVFDAWRSIITQQALYESYQQQLAKANPTWSASQLKAATLRIVALPSTLADKPSPHNTGGSIDLSIVDPQGRLLEMASPFDDTSNYAKTSYFEENQPTNPTEVTARNNRRWLYQIMLTAGFTNYPEEWWHYDFGNQNWAYQSQQNQAIYGATQPNFPW